MTEGSILETAFDEKTIDEFERPKEFADMNEHEKRRYIRRKFRKSP